MNEPIGTEASSGLWVYRIPFPISITKPDGSVVLIGSWTATFDNTTSRYGHVFTKDV